MVSKEPISDTADWPIMEGMTVYGIDGEKLGNVRNYDPQADYLDVQKGWLFHKDFYVPVSAVNAVMGDGLTLRLTHQDLDDDRYTSPPGAGGVVYGDSFAVVEKEPLDVTNEEVPVSRASGMPVY